MKTILTTFLALSLLTAPLLAAPPKKAPPKKPMAPPVKPKKPGDGGLSKGAKQMAGGDGVFGTVYTLDDGFNTAILSVRYTLEPHGDYNGTMPGSDEKLVWITVAVKNSGTGDSLWGSLDCTLVDDSGQNYTNGSGMTKLASQGGKELSVNLKPGQGVGQDPVKDELSYAVPVPGKAKIVKIIVNHGRKNVPGEKVLRYTVAGNPGGSPKNVIAPLPKYAADPTDPTGATLAIPATAVMGKYYPDGYFAVRLDNFEVSDQVIYENERPEEGKTYAIFTFTAKNIYPKPITTFELKAGQSDKIVLRDADGEKYNVAGDPGYAFRKAKRDEAFDSQEVEVGEEVSYRYVFSIPKDAKPASITFGQGTYGHAYKVDLTKAP